MRITVEGVVGVQAIPVLRTVVIPLQNGIRVPSLSIEVCVVSRISASLSIALLSLKPLVSLPVGGVQKSCGSLKRFMSRGSPFSLCCRKSTFQPGWALWISVFPYLLLEASLEVSMRASLLRLKPVEESPKLLRPSLSFWKLCLAIAEYPLAWIFSALMEGMYPPYPGTAVFLGSRESLVMDGLLCCGSARRMICTCCPASTAGSPANQ